MPDITMCSNDQCRRRLKCYRFTAIPNDRQSYAKFDGKKCFLKVLAFPNKKAEYSRKQTNGNIMPVESKNIHKRHGST